MKNLIKILLLPIALGNTACSVIYDINQDRVTEYCNSLRNPDERQACRQRNRTSYEDYERDRQKLIKGDTKK